MNFYKFNIVAFLEFVEAGCDGHGDRQSGLVGVGGDSAVLSLPPCACSLLQVLFWVCCVLRLSPSMARYCKVKIE